MQFIPFFITDKNTPIDTGVDFALANHQLSDANKANVRLGYRFLYQYRGSADTFNTYRKEIEKLYQYFHIHQPSKLLNKLKADDLELFFEFSVEPKPAWVSTKSERRIIRNTPNELWRPYNLGRGAGGRTSQKSLTTLFAVISSFYDYLTLEGAAEYNPVRNIRQKSRFFVRNTKDPIRRLSNLQAEYLFKVAANDGNSERATWVVTLLMDCYLRISEIVATNYHSPAMNDVFRDENSVWWLRVVGKGRKERVIPLAAKTMEALKAYRESLNLSPYPSRSDSAPLLHDLRYKTKLIPLKSARSVRVFVDYLFKATCQMMAEDGYQYEAEALNDATVHWLRHTGISEDVKRRPKEHVKEDAGHGSMVVTERYIDIELQERAASRLNS